MITSTSSQASAPSSAAPSIAAPASAAPSSSDAALSTTHTTPTARPVSPQESSQDSRPGGRYSRLPLLAGKGFIPLGLFARLPLAMLTVGALTLVTSVSGSYAVGGAAAGAVGIGSALGAPVLGALADRLGQRSVLIFTAIFNTVAVAALILTAYFVPAGQDLAAALPVLAAAFVAGASCPQVGPLARVRWMALTARGGRDSRAQDLDAALSYESTADELTFVLGPALVGILASLIAPWIPLALAAALTATLVPAFAVHRTHLAVPLSVRRPRTGRPQSPRSSRSAGTAAEPGDPGSRGTGMAAVALPFLAMVCMGTFFGSTQTGLSSFSASFATAEIAGLLYAVMGLSSAAAALSVAYWPQRFSLSARWMVSAASMAGLAVLLLLPGSAFPMVLVLLVLGLPVGPLMVTVFAIGGVVAPAGRLGTVMTALASGIVAGTALGSSIAGQLAQHQGYTAAFLVPVCAAAGLFLLGAAAAVVVRNRKTTAAAGN
jgi:MFS family permease